MLHSNYLLFKLTFFYVAICSSLIYKQSTNWLWLTARSFVSTSAVRRGQLVKTTRLSLSLLYAIREISSGTQRAVTSHRFVATEHRVDRAAIICAGRLQSIEPHLGFSTVAGNRFQHINDERGIRQFTLSHNVYIFTMATFTTSTPVLVVAAIAIASPEKEKQYEKNWT